MSRQRYNDIDWLRVLAMMMVFLFHCARFFNNEDWHVKNSALSDGLSVFVGIVSQWIMPLFFVLSGMSSFYALQGRNGSRFVADRVKRLLIPFVFGVFVLIPPQVYIERVTHGQYIGSFIEFYPHYFDGWYAFGGNFAWMGLHLWYLEFLFIFSLLVLPIFLYLGRKTEQAKMHRIHGFLSRPFFLITLFVPLFLMERLVSLDPEGFGRRELGGWSVMVYLVFFILGYWVAGSKSYRTVAIRIRWPALALGSMLVVIGYHMVVSDTVYPSGLFGLLRTLNAWTWILAFIGLAANYLNRTGKFLLYANEAVLPFYILHQTVIIITGYFIAGKDWSVFTKFVFISSVSLVVIVLLYELFVRRVHVIRFLFGLKGKAG